MDETILVYFLFQEFSEVRDVFSVGMQFCGSQKGPWVGSASFILNQIVSVAMSHIQMSLSSQ